MACPPYQMLCSPVGQQMKWKEKIQMHTCTVKCLPLLNVDGGYIGNYDPFSKIKFCECVSAFMVKYWEKTDDVAYV